MKSDPKGDSEIIRAAFLVSGKITIALLPTSQTAFTPQRGRPPPKTVGMGLPRALEAMEMEPLPQWVRNVGFLPRWA